jgi:predicted KAP-like P-loop ATPase
MSEVLSPDTLEYLSDMETKVDLLNNEAIAKTILRLVLRRSDKPITVGVHGDWGAGKSSVLEMVEAGLKEEPRTLCLKFNGWQFQGFEDAKIALIEGVLTGLIEERSLLTKAAGVVKQAWDSLDKLKLLKGLGKLGVALTTGIPLHGMAMADMISAVGNNADQLASDADRKRAVVQGFNGVFKGDKAFARPSAPHEIAGFRDAFKKLIKEAEIDRLVVLVDDLDRCLPDTAIETLEAIRLFVLMEKTAFIVCADERMIEYAVLRHFPNLPEMDDSQGYARAYLEKLLQVPFRIPALGETETRIYVTLLLLGAALDTKEDAPLFDRVLELARRALGRPWEGTGLAEADLVSVLGDRLGTLRSKLTLAEQISSVLSAGTKGNPRQIKRFLNALTLRLAVAEARNFGNAIEQAHLGKLMLVDKI